jgi:hypothetical protein
LGTTTENETITLWYFVLHIHSKLPSEFSSNSPDSGSPMLPSGESTSLLGLSASTSTGREVGLAATAPPEDISVGVDLWDLCLGESTSKQQQCKFFK